jgi:hypothetical protein
MTYAGMRCDPHAVERGRRLNGDSDTERLRALIREWEARRQRAEDTLEELRLRLTIAEGR